MHKKANSLTLLLLSLSLGSVSLANAQVTAPLENKLESKKEWLANMQKNLPSLLCDKEHYFVQCFETDEKACVELTTLLVQSCLNNISQSLPKELTPPQVEYWGQMVGRCSYDVYQKMLQSKQRHTPACSEPAKTHQDLPKPAQAVP